MDDLRIQEIAHRKELVDNANHGRMENAIKINDIAVQKAFNIHADLLPLGYEMAKLILGIAQAMFYPEIVRD